MNCLNLVKLVVLALVVSVGTTGCRRGPKNITPIPGRQAGTISDGTKLGGPILPDRERGPVIPTDSDPTRSALKKDGDMTELSPNRFDRANFNADRETFRKETVYFDFDKSSVKPSEQDKIKAVAAYLKNEPRLMIEIEGHCDERGTAEYNRALGERRALAIREFLIGLGVIGERIATLSHGEDMPADPGHGEAAWAKNRRGEFVLLRPK